jgi:hypothetical protein
MGYLKKVGNISVDGTKIHANASKHSAVSYKRAAEMIAEAEKEVGNCLRRRRKWTAGRWKRGLQYRRR